MKLKFKRELKVQHDSLNNSEYSRKILSEYIAWIAQMFSNLGYRVETGADEFRVMECLWGPNINDNKIYCLMCKAMAELTLKWTGIDGKYNSHLSFRSKSSQMQVFILLLVTKIIPDQIFNIIFHLNK